MSIRSEAVKRWRKNTRLRIIKSMGGECCICGYKKCKGALELHHIDPLKKDFSFGRIISNPHTWMVIAKELEKCILLCSNHHREVHNNMASIPIIYKHFDINFLQMTDYETVGCKECGKEIMAINKYCSKACSAKAAGKTKWEDINLFELLNGNLSYEEIGEMVGVSGASVLKRTRTYYLELLGKRLTYIKRLCLKCGTKLNWKIKTGLCMNCYNFKKRKVERPTKEQLEEKLKTMSWVAIAREYGVSDNGIRKWARSYGIIY